jgi:hypothetical protein
MEANMENLALILAGVIGAATAIIHGVVTQRLMVRPLLAAVEHQEMREPIKRLFPLLLQFSTLCWFGGGLALIAAALWFDPSSRLTTSLFVASFYAVGALGNLWGTRGRHPGWLLLAISVGLIGFGAVGPV